MVIFLVIISFNSIKGTIKTLTPSDVCEVETSFNSIKGTIKTIIDAASNASPNCFNSIKGTIKTRVPRHTGVNDYWHHCTCKVTKKERKNVDVER